MENNIPTVILCGGKGQRMQPFTNTVPKPLLKVHGKPILWYILKTLKKYGFHRIIFPLGYKGNMIQEYVLREFSNSEFDFSFVETGDDSLIKTRIMEISHLLSENQDFFLINSDTIFDFDITSMYGFHKSQDALVTLASVEIASTWGLLIEKNNQLINFSRERKIEYLMTDNESDAKGFIYSGISFINSTTLQLLDNSSPTDFEETLFQKVINLERAGRFRINGAWFAIDTPKDLLAINAFDADALQFD
jgi:glucose-1-phosphate cytidylyltransferase